MLQPEADYADALVDEMIALDPTGFGAQDAAVHAKVRTILGTAVVRVVLTMLADARVSFSAGQLGGTDTGGDAPTLVTASGGVIS